MGIIDKFKKNGADDESYEEMYASDIYDDYGYNYSDGNDGDDQDYGMYSQDSGSTVSSGSASAYNNANATGGISIGGASLEMKVVKPEHFESVPQIADHLLNKRTVVLNLEKANKETARRLIDFLSGVAYSIDGSLRKIASNAYVITPNNVDVGEAKLSDNKASQPAKEETPAETSDASIGGQFGEF